MRSKPAHLLFGMLLFAGSAFVAWRMEQGWRPLWQQQQSASPRADHPSFDPTAGDPMIAEATKLHLYGILTSVPATQNVQNKSAPGHDAAPHNGSIVASGGGNAAPAAPPRRLLRGRFSVADYKQFQFVVPAHELHPRLRGTYNAVGTDDAGEASAKVDVLLLTDDEFKEFLHGNVLSSRFVSNPASSGEISWLLTPTFLAPQKYHLVFHNSAVSGSARVRAEFSVSF
jgi:hypothetical protein